MLPEIIQKSEFLPYNTNTYVHDENPARVYIDNLPSPASRKTMQAMLNLIAHEIFAAPPIEEVTYRGKRTSRQVTTCWYCRWGALRATDTQRIRAWFVAQMEPAAVGEKPRFAPATVNKALAAVRGVLKAAWRLGQIATDEYQRAVDIASVPSTRGIRGRDLEEHEIDKLVKAAVNDPSPTGRRDVALIALLYNAGLRRAEVAALAFDDINLETGEIIVRQGKGRKERSTFVGDSTLDALYDWLQVRGDQAGPFFCRIRKGGKLVYTALSDQAILYILQKRGDAVPLKAFSPHDFRRTFIGGMLDAGVDIVTVQKMVGHASPNTTALYDRRGQRAKKRAAKKMQIAYISPLRSREGATDDDTEA
jgi:integrase